MKRITDLVKHSSPIGLDVLPIVDITTNTTKYVTRLDLLRGAVDTIDIKDGAITSPKLAPTKTTDANGWTVQDFGNRKLYTRKYIWTGSTSIAQNASISLAGLALPVGVSSRAALVATYSGRCTDRTFVINERITDTATSFQFEVNNWYQPAAITLTYVYIDIVAWGVS